MQLAGVDVELSRAEFDKYAAPLLLVHGLWSGPHLWRPTASYLAHRGWNSYVLCWREAAQNWVDLLACAERAADALGKPVIVGHDLGALVALRLERVRAAVAIAPLPCGPESSPHPFASSLRGRWARWRGAELLPTEAEARRVLGLNREQLRPEASRWLDEIGAIDLCAASDALPRIVLAGAEDPCAPRREVEALAARAGAECRVEAAAGHDLLYGPRWQTTAAQVHRWLVQRLGESVLLLRGDEDLRDE